MVCAALLAIEPVRASSWADVRITPTTIPVLAGPGGDEAQITIEIDNSVPVPLRVDEVRLVFSRKEATLARRRFSDGFFEETRFSRERRLDRGGKITWQAVCLTDVPPGADRVRLELVLSARRRYEEGRTVATASADLVPAPEPLSVALPFRGHWRVTQGNGCGTNHRIGGRGSEFAWDFAAVDRSGNVMPDRGKRNEDSPSFGRPVLAPTAGRVVRVVDEYEDNEGFDDYPRRSLLDDLRRPDWVYGNYVVLEASPSRFLLLAHLETGSVVVAKGDVVAQGDPIARAGNSGNSRSPHLHVHAMDRADPSDPEVRGVPILFTRFVEIRGAGEGEEREIVVRKVVEGTPVETAVVAPDVEGSSR